MRHSVTLVVFEIIVRAIEAKKNSNGLTTPLTCTYTESSLYSRRSFSCAIFSFVIVDLPDFFPFNDSHNDPHSRTLSTRYRRHNRENQCRQRYTLSMHDNLKILAFAIVKNRSILMNVEQKHLLSRVVKRSTNYRNPIDHNTLCYLNSKQWRTSFGSHVV